MAGKWLWKKDKKRPGRDLSPEEINDNRFKDVSQLTMKLSAVEDERDMYMSKAKVLESENGDLKVQLQSLNRKVKFEEDDLKINQEKLRSLEESNTSLSHNVSQLSTELKAVKDERDMCFSENATKMKHLEARLHVREDDSKDEQEKLYEARRQLKEIQQSDAQREKIDLEKTVRDQKETIERLKGEKEKLSDDLINCMKKLEDKADESSKRLEALEKEKIALEERNEKFKVNMFKKIEEVSIVIEEMKKSLKIIEKRQNIETLLSTQLREGQLSVLQTVVVDRVLHKWRGIATFLKFSINKMNSIEHDASREKRDVCLMMFSEWLREARETGNLPRTLRSICEALNDRDEKQVADELVAAIQNA